MVNGCLLVLSVVSAALAADEVPEYMKDSCWQKEVDKYMPCDAAGTETKGTLDEMKEVCYDYDDACAGITCNDDETECTLRHYPQCDTANGAFLVDSPDDEVTYVKTCALADYVFSQKANTRRSCNDPSRGGDLLQNKIACALKGPEFCAGVQCSVDKVTQSPVNCYTIEYDFCGSQLHATTAEVGAVFVEMSPKDHIPYNLECDWTLKENVVFQCNQPKSTELLPYTFDEAKLRCLTAKSGEGHCNGVYCKEANPLKKNNCQIHEHCVEHRELQLVAGEGMVYLTRCTEGPFCVSECWDVPELSGHVCSSDCDCSKRRVCSSMGYCHDPEDIGRDVPPAAPTPAPAKSKSSHAFLMVVLVFMLIAVVAGLAYRNRQLASQYVAPTNFHHAIPQNDDDWIVEHEEKEEN